MLRDMPMLPPNQISQSSKSLKVALFILVPSAYLRMLLSRLSPIYHNVPLTCAILIPAAAVVSVLSLNTHRVVALLGLLPAFLWIMALMLPTL